jgi:hypothetical protein
MSDDKEINGYNLSRTWFNFCLDNPDKIKPNHTALYFWAIETFNRFDWKQKVGLPTSHAMEVLGIKSYNTYIGTLNDLVEFGFIKMVERSKNQYSANIIALSNFNKAQVKATSKHLIKQSESTIQSNSESISSITKPINNTKPINLETIKSIDSRKLKFADTLKPFLEIYGKEFLNEFYKYWTEPNKSNSKFRQELQKTWDVKRRLETWAKNDKNFKKIDNGKQQFANSTKTSYEFSVDRVIETYTGDS